MKNFALTLFALYLLFMGSCNVEPAIINYGSDGCYFCKMTIVDQQHAAQFVTKKGKQFKFDAIECMLNEMSEKEISNIAIYMVSDYASPQSMTDAQNATFLISPEIKSPMGANLSAFSKKGNAQQFIKTNEDKLYSWATIKDKYSIK